MIGDADLPADEDALADHDRAREASLCGDDRPLADLAVVTDVDLRVELCPAPDDRRTDGPRGDRAKRTDVHVVLDDDATELRDLARLAVRAGDEAEARGADHGAGRDRHACPDLHAGK